MEETNSALLEEVFHEIESSESDPVVEKPKTKKSSGFLEDVVNYEKEILSKKNKELKKIKSKQNDDELQILKDVKSLIHEGLTDSSDDEDNKYFEETKYNECGKTVKKMLKEKDKPRDGITLGSGKDESSWKNAQIAREKLKMQLDQIKNNATKGDLFVDPVLGMRIVKPLISSTMLKEKMIGRVGIGTGKIKKFLESPSAKESDWVTGGAVISKYTRTSQKGNPYCIWNLTDLNGEIKTICVFLFGSAYKEYWKTSLGTVVGILNPVVMDNKDKSEATLRVDNAQKILLMGMSKDYGICKSKKKNGENCSSVVNLARCEVCTYHIKQEYIKACRRSDLQPPKIGRSLDNLKAKVLGKNEVFYAGKSFTGKKSLKLSEKDEQRLKYLSENCSGNVGQSKKNLSTVSQSLMNKDKDILNRLSGVQQSPKTLPHVSQSSKSVPLISQTLINSPSTCNTPKSNLPQIPQQSEIDLDFVVTKKDISAAKANALKYIRRNGPIQKTVDKDRAKRTSEQILSVKRKLEAMEGEVESNTKKSKVEESTVAKQNPLKDKMAKMGITDEFLKVMNTEVKDGNLLKVAETEEREKYFNKLEMKEKMEDKMASTFKVDCKAVRCLKCNYKSFSASELCKKEKHPLKVINAVKRFWKCSKCGARTVCLELIPLHSCKNCGNSKWERASMMPDKKGPNLTVEPLSLRGNEEKFIGAVVKNASLNLLVPDENS